MHTLTCVRVCRIHIHARTRTCTGKVLQIFFFWRMVNREKTHTHTHSHTLAQQQPTVTATNHKERMEEDRAKGTKMENNQNFISSDNSGKNGSNGS